MYKPSDMIKERRHLVIIFFLVIITALAYWRIIGQEFINYDDYIYVVDNYQVHKGLSLDAMKWAFTTLYPGIWHPLVWVSYMLDYELYGLNPAGYKVINLLLHIANSIILFHIFHRSTKKIWQSAFVAAVFAIHPLHVESVAWIAERKDVLSALFWFLTILAYFRYAENGSVRRSIYVMVFFILGLMAKPMLVTLPFALLLLDFWPLKRTIDLKLLLEKIPLFIIAVIFSVIAYIAQLKAGAIAPLDAISFIMRGENALVSYLIYIKKAFLPTGLAVFYPYHINDITVAKAIRALAMLISITIIALIVGFKRRYLLVGWLWFLGTLVPVIGFVQIGMQAMADRYMYVPLIGLSIMIAWGVGDSISGWRYKRLVIITSATFAIAALFILTYRQVGYWKDSVTLFNHALSVTKNNYMAHHRLANTFASKGEFMAAITHNYEALKIKPNLKDAYSNIRFHMTELEIIPESAVFLSGMNYNLAVLFIEKGRLEDGIYHYKEAARIKPDYAAPHLDLGVIYGKQGEFDNAVEEFKKVITLDAENPLGYYNIGLAYEKKGMIKEAIRHYRKALLLKPDYEQASKRLIAIEKSEED